MKLYNAKQLCDQAAAKGFGIPALNNNGGTYDIGRAIIEAVRRIAIAAHHPVLRTQPGIPRLRLRRAS